MEFFQYIATPKAVQESVLKKLEEKKKAEKH
jgi:hypothetical protein